MKISPFIRKLKLIIQTISPEIAGWNEDGTLFEVIDSRSFSMNLSKYFKGSEPTFVRQLNLYGFTKSECTRNLRRLEKPLPLALPGAWSISHPLLLRDSLDLMDNIVRGGEKRLGQLMAGNDSTDDADNDENEIANSRELIQMRKKNEDLEAVIETLQVKLAILTAFLEKEGYDPQALFKSDIPCKKKSRTEKSIEIDNTDESNNNMLSKKRDRDEFGLLSSIEKQMLVDLLFQPSVSSSNDDIPTIMSPIFYEQGLTYQQSLNFDIPSTNADSQLQDKTQTNYEIEIINANSKNTVTESVSNESINENASRSDGSVSIANCACKTDNLTIDTETVSKVVIHLKEALHAAMNAEISCNPACFAHGPMDTLSNFQSKFSNMSNSMLPKANDNPTNGLTPCCILLKWKFMSLKLPQLVSLPQISSAL